LSPSPLILPSFLTFMSTKFVKYIFLGRFKLSDYFIFPGLCVDKTSYQERLVKTCFILYANYYILHTLNKVQ
jgi:hypothetical protein